MSASMFDIGEKRGHHSEQRQIRANAIDEFDSMPVGESAEHGRADAADPEGESEEQAGDGADLAGHQLLGEYHDGGECRGQNQPDDETQGAGPLKIDERQENREGSHAQYRDPDDPLAADAVADGAAEQGPERHRDKKSEQIDLSRSTRKLNFVDQIETVEARDAGGIE